MFGSAAEVKTQTGTKPKDLGFDTDNEFTAWLDGQLTRVTRLIEESRNREEADIMAEGWGEIADGVAERWLAEAIRLFMATRSSPIVQIEDFQVETISDEVPGSGVMHQLKLIPRAQSKRRTLEMRVLRKRS